MFLHASLFLALHLLDYLDTSMPLSVFVPENLLPMVVVHPGNLPIFLTQITLLPQVLPPLLSTLVFYFLTHFNILPYTIFNYYLTTYVCISYFTSKKVSLLRAGTVSHFFGMFLLFPVLKVLLPQYHRSTKWLTSNNIH